MRNQGIKVLARKSVLSTLTTTTTTTTTTTITTKSVPQLVNLKVSLITIAVE